MRLRLPLSVGLRKRNRRHDALAAALAAGAVLLAPAAHAQKNAAKTRKVFVSVTDAAGLPVDDLQPGECDVREGGVGRTVVRAGLATSPMRVALLVDTSETAAPSLNHIRSGIAAFFDALPAKHEALLASTGRQLRVDTRSRRLRERFAVAAAAERGEVASTLTSIGVRHVVLTTSGDWLRPLVAFLRRSRSS